MTHNAKIPVMHRLLLPFLLIVLCLLAPPAPGPAAKIAWRDDYERARAEANAAHRPLLVVFACQRRPAVVGFDTRDDATTDPELAARIARGYVPVRLRSIKGVDLNVFRFDYDLQFAVLVLDGRDQKILARWGTRDADSAEARLSLASLKYTLDAAANAYAARKDTAVRPTTRPRLLTDDPAFAASRRAGEACYHCHYAYDAALLRARKAGTFTTTQLFRYPLPESLGVTLNPAQNAHITAVRPGSIAAGKLRVGDFLRRANNTPVYSSADLQAVLDTVPSPGNLTLTVERAGKMLSPVSLSLPRHWRTGEDISWRPSQGGVPPFLGTWETPLTDTERAALGIPVGKLALRITTLFAGEKWAPTYGSLAVGDVLIAADGIAPPAMDARHFHTWFRLRYRVGETAHLTVAREGKRLIISVPCRDVAWQ